MVTLSMLRTIRSAQHSQSSTRHLLSEVERKWSCLLDELSWLCDYKTGGKSVTSVTAQATATGNVFWFTSNTDTRVLAKRQLCWILRELQRLAASDIDSGEVQWRLFKKSVAFSHRRVESYWDRLNALVEHAGLNCTDTQLTEYLAKLIVLRDDHEQLCLLAYRDRGSPVSIRLRQRMLESQPCSIWQAVRHYIGRQGSWWNACSILVSTARRDPSMFLEARAKAVCHQMSIGINQSGGKNESARVGYAPGMQEEQARWLASVPVLLAQQWGDSAAAEFMGRFQRRRAETVVHAELLVLDHFHQGAFKFAEGVRYIGYSKVVLLLQPHLHEGAPTGSPASSMPREYMDSMDNADPNERSEREAWRPRCKNASRDDPSYVT